MSAFGLEYIRDVENQLAMLWLASGDRNGVIRSQHVIDQVLSSDPHLGTQVSEGLWRIIIPPLAAFYEINESNFHITVTSFGSVRK